MRQELLTYIGVLAAVHVITVCFCLIVAAATAAAIRTA